jgi:hypothetical protein
MAAKFLNGGLASRYEALIRRAETIRSHPNEKDLFGTCANELHQVIPFHGLSQFDPTANVVHWHCEQQPGEFDKWREDWNGAAYHSAGRIDFQVGLRSSAATRYPVG